MTTGSGFTGEFTRPGCSVDSEAGRARNQVTGEHRSGLPGLAALAAGVWTLYILASHRARRRSAPGESEAAAAAAEPLRRQGPGEEEGKEAPRQRSRKRRKRAAPGPPEAPTPPARPHNNRAERLRGSGDREALRAEPGGRTAQNRATAPQPRPNGPGPRRRQRRAAQSERPEPGRGIQKAGLGPATTEGCADP